MIYSMNRVGGASVKIAANESYTDHDIGRILEECAINDMRIFNNGMARDFKEAVAMNEGTMTNSELRAFQEFSVKEAWKSLCEKVKRLWAKIKGVFRSAYAKLSLWLNKSNKLYVAQNRKLLEKKNLNGCPLPKYQAPKADLGNKVDAYLKNIKGIVADLKANKYVAQNADRIGEINAETIYNSLEDQCFAKADENAKWPISGVSLEGIFTSLSASSKYMKDFKKTSKEMDKLFSDLVKTLDKKAAEFKDDKEIKDHKTKGNYEADSKAVSKFQANTTAVTSAFIKIIKKAISNDRGLISTLVAYGPKAEATYMEMAFGVGAEAYYLEADDMSPEEVAEEAEEIKLNISIDVDGAEVEDVDTSDDSDDE